MRHVETSLKRVLWRDGNAFLSPTRHTLRSPFERMWSGPRFVCTLRCFIMMVMTVSKYEIRKSCYVLRVSRHMLIPRVLQPAALAICRPRDLDCVAVVLHRFVVVVVVASCHTVHVDIYTVLRVTLNVFKRVICFTVHVDAVLKRVAVFFA